MVVVYDKINPQQANKYFRIRVGSAIKYLHKQTACWLLTTSKKRLSSDRLIRVRKSEEKWQVFVRNSAFCVVLFRIMKYFWCSFFWNLVFSHSTCARSKPPLILLKIKLVFVNRFHMIELSFSTKKVLGRCWAGAGQVLRCWTGAEVLNRCWGAGVLGAPHLHLPPWDVVSLRLLFFYFYFLLVGNHQVKHWTKHLG